MKDCSPVGTRPRGFPTWVLLVAPVVTLMVSNADVLLLGAAKGDLRSELRTVLATTVPLTAMACGLTTWILLRLRREIGRRAASEAELMLALGSRDTALESLRRSLEREQRLRRELDHRVRNNLSSLMGLFGLYQGSGLSPERMMDSLRGKVSVLCEAYGLIAATAESGVRLDELLRSIVGSALSAAEPRLVQIEGPAVRLPAREANAMAMIAQELAANSSKHGALRSNGGEIHISWTVSEVAATSLLALKWEEWPVDASRGTRADGIGLRLIEGFAASDLRGGATFRQEDGRWIVELTTSIEHEQPATVEGVARQEVGTCAFK